MCGITKGYASMIYGILGTLAAIWLLLVLWGGENKMDTALNELELKTSALEAEIQRIEHRAAPQLSGLSQKLDLESLQTHTANLQENVAKALANRDSDLITSTKADVDQQLQVLQSLLAAPNSVSTHSESVIVIKRLNQEVGELKAEAKRTLEALFTKYPSEITRADSFLASLNQLQNRIERFTTAADGSPASTRDQQALEALTKQSQELQLKLQQESP